MLWRQWRSSRFAWKLLSHKYRARQSLQTWQLLSKIDCRCKSTTMYHPYRCLKQDKRHIPNTNYTIEKSLDRDNLLLISSVLYRGDRNPHHGQLMADACTTNQVNSLNQRFTKIIITNGMFEQRAALTYQSRSLEYSQEKTKAELG